jgi:hypothetical protein
VSMFSRVDEYVPLIGDFTIPGDWIPPSLLPPPLYWLKGAERDQWVRENEHRFTWLYAIAEGEPGEQGPIKIGVAADPDARLCAMQTGNSRVLTGMAAWRTVPEDEVWFHKLLDPIRIRGEWFKAHPWLARLLITWGANYEWSSRRYWDS